MHNREITINRLAQELNPIESGIEWFKSESEEERKEILRSLDLCLLQSHPNSDDITLGIKQSGLKETYSPCVLFLKRPLNEARQKLLAFKGIDQERGFLLLLSIFSIADKRRRETECKNGCTHVWHNLK